MKKNISKIYKVLLMTVSALFMAGCVTEMPSDITVDELEIKMSKAMDPHGVYRRAHAYFQRQNVEEEGFWSTDRQMVEVRFQRPDKFKFSYYEKNKVATEILSAGGKAWSINHKDGIISSLTGSAMEKFKVMLALGHPDTDYDKLFDKVQLSIVTLEDDREYYKMVCHTRIKDSYPIIIYVDRIEALPKRMVLTVKTPNGIVTSTSDIEQYGKFDQVKLPVFTRVQDGSREYTTRVVGYQLNATFKSQEFAVPEFDPVLMEMKKRKRR